jgi:hypothetical protein
MSRLTDGGSVEEIAGIKLDARCGRQDFHHPARCRIVKHRGPAQRSVRIVDDEIMIVAAAITQLLVIAIANASADRPW